MSSDCRVAPTKSSTLFIRLRSVSFAEPLGEDSITSIQRESENSSPAELKASTTPSVKRTSVSPGCRVTEEEEKGASGIIPKGKLEDSNRSIEPFILRITGELCPALRKSSSRVAGS